MLVDFGNMFGMFTEGCSSEVSTFTFLGRSNVAVIICGPTSVGSGSNFLWLQSLQSIVDGSNMASHIFSQIWARFCSFSVGARFDPENDDPPTRLKRGYTMLHISSSGAPRVVESGFAGPIIVLVRVFEGNFSTKPWFSRISMGFLKLLTIQEIDIDVENP